AYFDGAPSSVQNLNQTMNYEQSTQSISASILYTEPLSKDLSVQVKYQAVLDNGFNNQVTYQYSDASGKYDYLIDSLSNNFKQNILQNIPAVTFNCADKKLKANIGSGVGFTHFDLKDVTYGNDYIRNYSNFYPSANVTYTYKPNHSIRFNYSGRTVQPTINQLQPLRNNNDYFNQVIGNPDLKPSFRQSINIWHNNYNFLKDLWMYQSICASVTDNAITNNSMINLDSGKTISQPINVNGNYNVGFYGGVGFKVKKIDTRFDFSPSLSLNRFANVVNGEKSYSKTAAPGLRVY